MPICDKQKKKNVPFLTVQNTAYTEKTTRSYHLHSCFAVVDLRASASAGSAGSADCVYVDGSCDDVSVATSTAARLCRQ
jgi:hypothetical protein